MQRIGIVINPHAKAVRKSRRDMPAVLSRIAGEYADVRQSGSLDELDDIIRDFKKSGVHFIGTTGGDGTVHHMVTGMMKAYGPETPPPLVILKGGTMDNIARTVDLRGKGASILKRLVRRLDSGLPVETHRRDTMKIGDRYCFLFGAGLTTNFLNAVYQGEKGTIKNLRVIARAISEGISDKRDSELFRRLEADITIDGRPLFFREILAILAGTVEKVGMGFTPLPRGNERDGTFHLIISGEKPVEGVKQFFRIKRGAPMKGPLNFNDLASRIEIKSPVPFQYTMDGDLFDCPGHLIVEPGIPVELVRV